MCGLALYTVYRNPKDYPDKYVIRRGVVECGGFTVDSVPIVIADSLEAARNALPLGLVMLSRHPDDDPVIVEVWL